MTDDFVVGRLFGVEIVASQDDNQKTNEHYRTYCYTQGRYWKRMSGGEGSKFFNLEYLLNPRLKLKLFFTLNEISGGRGLDQ